MKCPKCRFENIEGVNFCVECGAKLEIICQNCSCVNSISNKFCGGCGHNLSFPSEVPAKDSSLGEKLTKIQKYLPKGLTEKILSQRDQIEGERKHITVMFCDMVGFTSLSESLGPEKSYTIMDQVYEILIHKVHDYEGTVNEMTGDGILALFGAPIALEDAPQRAIRAAYAIHREIGKFSESIRQHDDNIPPLKMRIGIHTGPVVVGTLGNDLRVEFKAVGDTVNLSSRIEAMAEPGTTLVTEETFNLTEGFFRFESLGKKEIKGKAESIKVYRVIAPSGSRTRFDVSAERGLTPFIGRDRELELLLDGFGRCKAGRGQTFSIVSEAGVGKSRLLYEFRKAVTNEDVTFIEGKCLSYSRAVAYHPVIDIVKSNFDIVESDGKSRIKKKIQLGLKALDVDENSTLPYLLELLGVKESGLDPYALSPEAMRGRVVETLNCITIKISHIRPLIIAIEDLHWIDKSSEEVLRSLLESTSGEKLFLIFTYRHGYVPNWTAKSYHNQVTLNRLSNRESLAMVNLLLGTENVGRDLEELILQKTEGVPFFIEEFIKSLRDLQIITKEDNRYRLAKDLEAVVIPSSIQDVIMARIDSLPEGSKEVLQTGSVIEREFSCDLINMVTDLTEQELSAHLSLLKDLELIYERGIYPQSTYIFKHALIRDVVVNSILDEKKKTLNEKIGRAIENLYKENIRDHCGALVDHFFKSQNYRKAAEYSKVAFEKAKRSASLLDAIAYAKRSVDSLERLPQTEDFQKKMIDARTDLGLLMGQMLYFADAKEAIDPVIDSALKLKHRRRLSQIYTLLGTYYIFVEEDFLKAFKQLYEALRISEEAKDFASLYLATYWLGIAQSYNCEFEKAFLNIEKTLDFAVRANRNWLISSRKSSIGYYAYYFQGKIDLSLQYTREGIRMAEEIGDIHSKAVAYSSHGAAFYGKGLLEEAIKYLLMAVDFCEKINLYAWNTDVLFTLGDIYFEIGEYQNSKIYYRKAIRILEHHRLFPSMTILNKIGFARAKVMQNEKDVDLTSLYSYVEKNRLKLNEGLIRRYMAEILLNIDDKHLADSEHWIKAAIKADMKNGMKLRLGQDYTLYAELLKRKEKTAEAEQNLRKAIKILKTCGADGFLNKANEILAGIN